MWFSDITTWFLNDCSNVMSYNNLTYDIKDFIIFFIE